MPENNKVDIADVYAALGWTGANRPRAMVLVAHPDDESIAFGAHLASMTGAILVYTTDGAPLDQRFWRAQGFEDAASYAQARRAELRAALQVAGVDETAAICLGCSDQEASFQLVDLTNQLATLFAEHAVEVVFTHAYEGGHPDHDATAFAAHAAAALKRKSGGQGPLLIEAPFYHSENGEAVRQQFIHLPDVAECSVELSAAAQAQKMRMYACHFTQRDTLSLFHVEREIFRRAPAYDFSQAPNGGEIFYDSFRWRFKSPRFLELTRQALKTLGS